MTALRRTSSRALAVVLAITCMAPVVGDVGTCAGPATEMDIDGFAWARKRVDCDRCQECGIATARCERACSVSSTPEVLIPRTCAPLARDGDVCLRALEAATCDDYTLFLDDVAPSSPTECQFCLREEGTFVP